VVPKSLWQTVNPPDERNLCTWAMRCLLVIHGKNILLIDTGLGDKQDAKFLSHYHLHGSTTLDSELARLGLTRADITDVLLTHLHFDHVGGAVVRRPDGLLVPSFPNARFHSCARHWDWAIRPNAREKASFLAENILPLEESGQLSFIPRDGRWTRDAFGDRFPGLDIFFADGHTESQMIPVLPHPSGTHLAFMADLLPSAGHVPAAWVMGYDTRPLLTLEDKDLLLTLAADEQWLLFLEHDPTHATCTVHHTEKGIRVAERG
jgi:glyoxylase-like metal-dependent hydrolase (beta-lactamase superfamily II)